MVYSDFFILEQFPRLTKVCDFWRIVLGDRATPDSTTDSIKGEGDRATPDSTTDSIIYNIFSDGHSFPMHIEMLTLYTNTIYCL